MEYNIAYYYDQKRKKKKINRIKVSFGIIAIFGIILFGRHQILKSNSSYIYDPNINQKGNISNEGSISVIIDNSKENIIESKEEACSKVSNETNNKNQLSISICF